MTARNILLLTTEPLPIGGVATTGAGLRAWGLAEGLRAQGLNVVIGAPADAYPSGISGHLPPHVRLFRRAAIGDLLAAEQPGCVVLQHWGLAAQVPEVAVALAIDLAGPHLLERIFWNTGALESDLAEKLAALRRADFLTCSGEYQRHYFYAFMAQAGWDMRSATLPVIPFSVPPGDEGAASAAREPHSFVYGGSFLGWQDPRLPLTWLLDEMDRAGRGSLHFYGGSHPVLDASAGKFAGFAEHLRAHPRVRMCGTRPFEELLNEYRRYEVAVDLMAHNPERELAFTTRTMVYLACGLPVIHDNYSELGALVARRECGWALSPADEPAFRQIARDILERRVDLRRIRENALQVAAEYSWDRTIEPLASFCRQPCIREGKLAASLAHDLAAREVEDLRESNASLQAELHALRRVPWKRVQAWFPSVAPLLAPLAWLAAWPLALWLWLWLSLRGGTQTHKTR